MTAQCERIEAVLNRFRPLLWADGIDIHGRRRATRALAMRLFTLSPAATAARFRYPNRILRRRRRSRPHRVIGADRDLPAPQG